METDCSYLLEGRNPSQILDKALVLLEHQVTKGDKERQLKIINQYIYVSEDGILVKDLANMMYLVFLLRNRLQEEPRYQVILSRLLSLCRLPPVLTKSSDILEYALDIEEFFSWLGYTVLCLTDKNSQLQILNGLHSLLTVEYPNKRCCLSLAVRKEKARQSILPQLFGELLELADDIIYNRILNVVQVLIQGSKQTCIELLQKGAVNTLLTRMEPSWRGRFPSVKPNIPERDQEISDIETIFEILSSLLGCASSDTMRAPTKFSLWSLQWTFRLFCIKEITSVERNNVLAILLLLMEIYPDLLSGNLTFSYDIAMLAMSRDIIFHPNWTTGIKLTTCIVDHSCMALLLMCISYFPNCLSGPKVIEECRVVMGLLKVIGHQQTIKWNQLQSCYLMRLALNILLKIVPASSEEFVEDGGPLTIIQLLNRSRELHNSYSFEIVCRSLEVLGHLSYKFKSIRDSVAYNGGLYCILPLLEDKLDQPYLSLQNQVLLGVGVCLLEQICTCEQVSLVLPMVLRYLKRYMKPNPEDPVQNPEIALVFLSFIWNKISYSVDNSKEFVKKGGIYLILDVLEMDCLPVRLVALGALIELCEKTECIPYLITWRKNGKRIKSLLIEIFRQENKELNVKTDKDGVIEDTNTLIMGKFQFYETFCKCARTTGNPSIADMFGSCRAKVYCVLQILNSKQLDSVEMADDIYHLYSEELSAQDEVTLLLAENFLALKLAEEWKELNEEFQKMRFEPIPSDNIIIDSMIQITNHWGVVLKRMQEEVLHKHLMRNANEERVLYTTIRDACLTDAWDALCQIKYIARCSERLFRISSNFNLQEQIVKCLQVHELEGQMHRTLQANISVSCLLNQNVDLPTDMFEEPGSIFRPKYSPSSSQESLSRFDQCRQEGKYIDEEPFLSKNLQIRNIAESLDPP